MSGALSVPLALASAFIPAPWFAKAGILILGAFCFLSATYLAWKAERIRVMSLLAKVASQGELEIDFIPGRRRFEEAPQGPHGTFRRTLSVRVQNVGGSTVRDCKLYFVSIEPNEGNLAGDIRMPSFTGTDLNPGDSAYVPLATYGELGTNVSGDTMGDLHVPFRAASGQEDGRSIRSDDKRMIALETDYIVTLRVTGSGSEACIRRFCISIREGGLRMMALKP